jgi:hypothetical protein
MQTHSKVCDGAQAADLSHHDNTGILNSVPDTHQGKIFDVVCRAAIQMYRDLFTSDIGFVVNKPIQRLRGLFSSRYQFRAN